MKMNIMARLGCTLAATVMMAAISPAQAETQSANGYTGKIASYLHKADRAEAQGDLGKVLMLRRKAAQAAPNDADLRVQLAKAYLAIDRNGAAVATFTDAIALGANAEAVRGYLHQAQFALNEADNARHMLASNSRPLWQGRETTALN